MRLTTPMLLLGAVLAYGYLSRSKTAPAADSWSGGSDIPTMGATTSAIKAQITQQFASREGALPGIAVNPTTGVIVADTIYKGRPSVSDAAWTHNLQKRYGPATPMLATDNPLEKIIQTVGGTSHIASRRPASQSESDAARAANLRSMISSGAKDPKTLSASSKALLGM